MTSPLTTAEIARLRALCEAATPGPWMWSEGMLTTGGAARVAEHILWPLNASEPYEPLTPSNYQRWWADRLGACGVKAEADAPHNAMLIAAARTALPALLDEIERLRAQAPTDLDLLLDCWRQFAMPVGDGGWAHDGGLSTLEDVAGRLEAAGRLMPVAERPDKDWYREAQAPPPAQETTAPKHPCACGHNHWADMDGEDGGCKGCNCSTWREPAPTGALASAEGVPCPECKGDGRCRRRHEPSIDCDERCMSCRGTGQRADEGNH